MTMKTLTYRGTWKLTSRRGRLGTWLVAGVAALALPACGDDTAETPTEAPLEPPELEIRTVETSVGKTVRLPSDTPLVLGCDRTLSVGVGPNPTRGRLKNWLLRPPDACAGRPQCGYVELTLDLGNEPLKHLSASTFITLTVPALADSPMTVNLTAQLFDDVREPFKLESGKPVIAKASIRLANAADCSGGSGGGSGSGGSAGQAGEAAE